MTKNNNNIRYIDLFSGIGGFALGLKQAGFIFKEHYAAEIDKNAWRIYAKHFDTATNLGDVATINDIPRDDPTLPTLITFGFPCQDLSNAGSRVGLEGKRSGLFYEAMRIIAKNKPDCFIFENVLGLLQSNEGQDFEAVLREIATLGLYECEWQVCNSDWLLPQHRERVFFVGYIANGKNRPKVFPLPDSDFPHNTIPTIKADTITAGYRKAQTRGDYIIEGEEVLSGKVRCLTPIEVERCMGFPDDWTDGISTSARYKALGNAVSPPIVAMIGRRIA